MLVQRGQRVKAHTDVQTTTVNAKGRSRQSASVGDSPVPVRSTINEYRNMPKSTNGIVATSAGLTVITKSP